MYADLYVNVCIANTKGPHENEQGNDVGVGVGDLQRRHRCRRGSLRPVLQRECSLDLYFLYTAGRDLNSRKCLRGPHRTSSILYC